MLQIKLPFSHLTRFQSLILVYYSISCYRFYRFNFSWPPSNIKYVESCLISYGMNLTREKGKNLTQKSEELFLTLLLYCAFYIFLSLDIVSCQIDAAE